MTHPTISRGLLSIALFGACLVLQSCALVPVAPIRPSVTVSPAFNTGRYSRLAVFVEDRTNRLGQGGVTREIEDEFMNAVIQNGYTLADRSNTEQVARELKFQQSVLTEKQIVSIGRLLNVPAVLIVSINSVTTSPYQPFIAVPGVSYFHTEASISARVISIDLGEVLWISKFTGGMNTEWSAGMGYRAPAYRGSAVSDTEKRALVSVANVVATGLPRRR